MFMSKFLIQKDSGAMDEERYFVLQQLRNSVRLHTYEEVLMSNLGQFNEKGWIPVGTIQFVQGYVRNVYGIKCENPIEIPKYLRTDEFLKRDYYFTDYYGIPRSGKFFLKDASELKKFGEVVFADYLLFDYEKVNEFDNTLVLSKDHIYLVSSLYHIQAEYRVYVFNNTIQGISFYNGDCTVFPDINLIKKAVLLISYNETWLRSYTIDVMVGKRGTALIEVHNFTSVGLYSTLWGVDLLYAYRDGIDYLIHDNKELEV